MGRYLLGVALAAVALVPVGFGAKALRRALLPGWRGLEAWLAEFVLGLVTVTLVAEALGTVGLFATAPVVIALALVGGSAAWLAPKWRRSDFRPADDRLAVGESPAPSPDADADGSPEAEPARSTQWWQTVVAGVVLLPLFGSWTTRTIRSIDDGMSTFDSIWYHLTVAARFVQTGRTGSIQFIDSDAVTAYFPASSSLLHGVGMLMFGSDLVSTVVNMGWLFVALAAAWMIGRPFGVSPLTMAGAGLLFATPLMVATQPGGVLNDVAGLALLLIAVALATRDRAADRTISLDLVISLAAGMAMGFKFSLIVPALAVGVALVVTARASPVDLSDAAGTGVRRLVRVVVPRGLRRRRALVVAVGMGAAGGYWYLRNLISTGNPLPSLDLSLGPISLPFVEGNVPTGRFTDYAFDSQAWEQHLLAGLEDALGPAWWALLAFVAIGIIGGIFHPSSRARMLAVLALVNLAAYAVSPQYIEALGAPVYFATNLRYASPGLVFGLVLFPVVARRWSWAALAAMGVAMVATQLDRVAWPSPLDRESFFHDEVTGLMTRGDAARGALPVMVAVVGGVVVWAAARRWPQVRSLVARWWFVVPALIVVALAVVHEDYTRDRYTQYGSLTPSYVWATSVEGARIGVSGGVLQLQYPYTGPEWDNHVQYIGIEDGDGGFRAARTCAEWVGRLEAGRYDYVVVMTPGLKEWTLTQSDARIADEINGTDGLSVSVFSLDPDREGRRC